MQRTRAIFGLLITTIALTLACGLLAMGKPCRPLRPGTDERAASLDALGQLQPKQPFEITVTESDLNTYLASLIRDREHATVTGITIQFDENAVTLDLCIRGILLRPVPIHAKFDVQPANDSPNVVCTEWHIGQIVMPASAEHLLSRWLNDQWPRIDRYWRIERWELSESSLHLAGFRR